MGIPDQVAGYFTVPVEVRPNTETAEAVYHIIYVKKHVGGNDSTVFAVNLPADTTNASIKKLCSALGNTLMEEFKFEEEHRRGYISLVDKASASRFLAKAKALNVDSKTTVVWESSGAVGSQRYYGLNRAKYVDEGELQDRVDSYMEDFAAAEEEKLRQVKEVSQQVDDDGFTVVVGSKRRSLGGIAAARVGDDEPPKKKKRSKEKEDFYRFQIREKKKKEMNNLLRRFQDDKRKVQELKERKRFRPY